MAAFHGCDYLQVDIFGEHVVVQGYIEANSAPIQKMKRVVDNVCGLKRKVRDITDILSVVKKNEILLSRKSFRKASGYLGYEQLEFDLGENLTSSSNAYLAPSLSNLEIPLQISSLFSGAGIMDLSFLEAGFDVVFALELDKDAVETYRHNIGSHVIQGDITKIDKSRIVKAPIMIGGSPCQGLSNSNRYTNYLDNPNNLLLKHFIDSIKNNKNCKVFVLENVPRILTAGEGKFKDEIFNVLSDFEITAGIMSSADMGSAQARERAIFIGSKIGKIELPAPLLKPEEYKTVREAFKGLHDTIPNQRHVSKPKKVTLERMSAVPPGGNVFSIPDNIRPKGQHSDMYKRLEWDKPSVTIVNPRKSCILHPEEDRILSVRECARLFDVSDNFEFKGKLSSMQQQIANAVPVRLMRSVAEAIKTSIQRFNDALTNFNGLQLV